MCTLGIFAITFALGSGSKLLVFLSMLFTGFFMRGYFSLGFELAAEVTYPEPESNSSSLLNAGSMIMGLILTLVAGQAIEIYGDFVANTCAFFLMLMASLVEYFTPSIQRRQNAMQISQDSKDVNKA